MPLEPQPFVSPGSGSGPVIWSVQVSGLYDNSNPFGPLIDGFAGSTQLGTLTEDIPSHTLLGAAVFPLAANTSNQCLEETDAYDGANDPPVITYAVGAAATSNAPLFAAGFLIGPPPVRGKSICGRA
jgi:hypothetical protein